MLTQEDFRPGLLRFGSIPFMPKQLPQLSIEIVLRAPPKGVAFALQQGKDTLVSHRQATGAELRFDLSIGCDLEGDVLDFRGPFVQGPRGGRFVYICCGEVAGQPGSPWRRRIKIQLGSIDAELVKACQAETGQSLRAVIAGTAKDGGPPAATVPLIESWTVVAT
jgi:hypothetical protein